MTYVFKLGCTAVCMTVDEPVCKRNLVAPQFTPDFKTSWVLAAPRTSKSSTVITGCVMESPLTDDSHLKVTQLISEMKWLEKNLIKNCMNMSWMDHWLFNASVQKFFIDHDQISVFASRPRSHNAAHLEPRTCLTWYGRKLRLATFHQPRNARAWISNAWQRCIQLEPWEVQTDVPPLLSQPRCHSMKSCKLWHDHLRPQHPFQPQVMDRSHLPAMPNLGHPLAHQLLKPTHCQIVHLYRPSNVWTHEICQLDFRQDKNIQTLSQQWACPSAADLLPVHLEQRHLRFWKDANGDPVTICLDVKCPSSRQNSTWYFWGCAKK